MKTQLFFLSLIVLFLNQCRQVAQNASETESNLVIDTSKSVGMKAQSIIALEDANGWDSSAGKSTIEALKKADIKLDKTNMIHLSVMCPVVKIDKDHLVGVDGDCLKKFNGKEAYLLKGLSGKYLYKESSRKLSEEKLNLEWEKITVVSSQVLAESGKSLVVLLVSGPKMAQLTLSNYSVANAPPKKPTGSFATVDMSCEQTSFGISIASSSFPANEVKTGSLISIGKDNITNSCYFLDKRGVGLFEPSGALVGLWVANDASGDQFAPVSKIAENYSAKKKGNSTTVTTSSSLAATTTSADTTCKPSLRYTYNYKYSEISIKVKNAKGTLDTIGVVPECVPVDINCNNGNKVTNGNDVEIVASSELIKKIKTNSVISAKTLYINGMQLHPAPATGDNWCK